MHGVTAPEILEEDKKEQDLGGFEPDLRTHYEKTPEEIILDNSVVVDLLTGQKRIARDKLEYEYRESFEDVEKVINNFEGRIVIPEFYDNLKFEDDPMSQRMQKLRNNSQKINIKDIKPREGFEEVEGPDNWDKKLAEYAYRENSVLVTYDSDFLNFPINYTTPGML